MKRTIFLVAILFFSLASVFSQSKHELTKLEATQRFQKFVKVNDYSNLPVDQYRSRYIYKSVDGAVINAIAKPLQRNTLARKPFEIKKIKSGWSALFLYKSKSGGRMIYMDVYGENIEVDAQDTIVLGNL